MWLCGYDMYLGLGPGWVGRCAPVIPSEHSFIVSSSQIEVAQRAKRDLFKPHDAVWGTDLPKDHKLWSDANKVALSLFPQLQVGKLLLRVQTLDYRLGLFVNITLTAVKGINQELTALWMIELQDRTILDQLTAASGGVCAIVGSSCCTYIPENDGEEGIITQAIQNLTQLRDAMNADLKPQHALFEWLMSGTWYQVLMKMMVPVLAILLLFCIFVICVRICSLLESYDSLHDSWFTG